MKKHATFNKSKVIAMKSLNSDDNFSTAFST